MPITLCLPATARMPFCTALVMQRLHRRACHLKDAPIFARGDNRMMSAMPQENGSRSPRRSPPRSRVVARLWHTAEKQVAEIEARLAAGGDAAALERDAKTVAIIARTVRDLVAIDAEAKAAAKEKTRPHAAKDESAGHGAQTQAGDFGARDIEHFRAELARRLAALRAEGSAEAS